VLIEIDAPAAPDGAPVLETAKHSLLESSLEAL
jgi:hypothetical protein